jgi:hypothetical protein
VHTAVNFVDGLLTYNINPGDIQVFPWLANQALCYEFYRLVSLRFHFKTESKTDITGKVMLGVDYDIVDQNPASTKELMNMQGSKFGPMWGNLSLVVSPTAFHGENKWMYTRAHTIQSLRNTDGCKLFFSAISDAVYTIGSLELEYTFEFKVPQVPKEPAQTPSEAAFVKLATPTAVPVDTWTNIPFDTVVFNNLEVKQPTPDQIVLPTGTYRVSCRTNTEATGAVGSMWSTEIKNDNPDYGVNAEQSARSSTDPLITDKQDVDWSGWFYSNAVDPFILKARLSAIDAGTNLAIASAQLMVERMTRNLKFAT